MNSLNSLVLTIGGGVALLALSLAIIFNRYYLYGRKASADAVKAFGKSIWGSVTKKIEAEQLNARDAALLFKDEIKSVASKPERIKVIEKSIADLEVRLASQTEWLEKGIQAAEKRLDDCVSQPEADVNYFKEQYLERNAAISENLDRIRKEIQEKRDDLESLRSGTGNAQERNKSLRDSIFSKSPNVRMFDLARRGGQLLVAWFQSLRKSFLLIFLYGLIGVTAYIDLFFGKYVASELQKDAIDVAGAADRLLSEQRFAVIAVFMFFGFALIIDIVNHQLAKYGKQSKGARGVHVLLAALTIGVSFVGTLVFAFMVRKGLTTNPAVSQVTAIAVIIFSAVLADIIFIKPIKAVAGLGTKKLVDAVRNLIAPFGSYALLAAFVLVWAVVLNGHSNDKIYIAASFVALLPVLLILIPSVAGLIEVAVKYVRKWVIYFAKRSSHGSKNAVTCLEKDIVVLVSEKNELDTSVSLVDTLAKKSAREHLDLCKKTFANDIEMLKRKANEVRAQIDEELEKYRGDGRLLGYRSGMTSGTIVEFKKMEKNN